MSSTIFSWEILPTFPPMRVDLNKEPSPTLPRGLHDFTGGECVFLNLDDAVPHVLQRPVEFGLRGERATVVAEDCYRRHLSLLRALELFKRRLELCFLLSL